MHTRIAKLLQRSSERFHFSTVFETRDWWISALVSSMLFMVLFILSVDFKILLRLHSWSIYYHFCHVDFRYLESHEDTILVEVQDNNKVVIGRAKIPVSSFTDTQVCYTNSSCYFHGNSEKWQAVFLTCERLENSRTKSYGGGLYILMNKNVLARFSFVWMYPCLWTIMDQPRSVLSLFFFCTKPIIQMSNLFWYYRNNRCCKVVQLWIQSYTTQFWKRQWGLKTSTAKCSILAVHGSGCWTSSQITMGCLMLIENWGDLLFSYV